MDVTGAVFAGLGAVAGLDAGGFLVAGRRHLLHGVVSRLVMRGRSASLRYVIACTALCAMILAPLLTLAVLSGEAGIAESRAAWWTLPATASQRLLPNARARQVYAACDGDGRNRESDTRQEREFHRQRAMKLSLASCVFCASASPRQMSACCDAETRRRGQNPHGANHFLAESMRAGHAGVPPDQ